MSHGIDYSEYFSKGDKMVNLIFGSHRTHSNHFSTLIFTKALPRITLEEMNLLTHDEVQPLVAKFL